VAITSELRQLRDTVVTLKNLAILWTVLSIAGAVIWGFFIGTAVASK
jgi:uncharacterized membrane protein YesL